MAYCYQPKSKEEKLAFARRENINASFKDLANVCANIRYKNALSALKFLEQAAEGLRPVRYFRHNKRRGHLRELGGKKGGYPKKAAAIVLDVLKNAIANSNAKGLGECKVIHAIANKQQIYRRLAPKGRRIRHDLETAFVEIVLKEIKSVSQQPKEEKQKEQITTSQKQPMQKVSNVEESQSQAQKEKVEEKQPKKEDNIEEQKQEKEIKNEAKKEKTPTNSKPTRKKFSEVIKKKPNTSGE
ncbi:MAG: uL22 family ribosomal protein [Candidatus Anstonellaceae archaeon]